MQEPSIRSNAAAGEIYGLVLTHKDHNSVRDKISWGGIASQKIICICWKKLFPEKLAADFKINLLIN